MHTINLKQTVPMNQMTLRYKNGFFFTNLNVVHQSLFIVHFLQSRDTRGLMKAAVATHLLKKHHHRHDSGGYGRSASIPDTHEYAYNYGNGYHDDLLGSPNSDAYDFDNSDGEEFEEYSVGAPHRNEIHIELLPTPNGHTGRQSYEPNMYDQYFYRSQPNLMPVDVPFVMGQMPAMLPEPMPMHGNSGLMPLPIGGGAPFVVPNMMPTPISNPMTQPHHVANSMPMNPINSMNIGHNEFEPIVGAANPNDFVSLQNISFV